MTRGRMLWMRAAMRAFPHLADIRDASAYRGDWRSLVVDHNRLNRSAVFVSRFAQISTDFTRRMGSSVKIRDYDFQVILDPTGNPNIYLPEPALSVYLKCSPTPPFNGEWECCCRFTITVISGKQGRPNLTWHSTLPDGRFTHDGHSTWGVHSIIPCTKLGEYLKNDTVSIKVRVRILMLTVQVIRSNGSSTSFEVMQSTPLSKLKRMIQSSTGNLWLLAGSSPILLSDDQAPIYLLVDGGIGGNHIVVMEEKDGLPIVRDIVKEAKILTGNRFLRLEHIIDFYRRCGRNPLRIEDVYLYRTCQDPNATVRYIMEGRNLGYCCDQCGTPDFIGQRSHCDICPDYDLCSKCASYSHIMPHRYVAKTKGRFVKMQFHDHSPKHTMTTHHPIFS